MIVRVGSAWAIEADGVKPFEPVLGGIEGAMLPGEDQARSQAARCERVGDGCKLDRFGPGADDESYVCRTQPSP